MKYFDDLKTVVEVNSYTKNKVGIDIVGEIFDKWFEELGFKVDIYRRELIGSTVIILQNTMKIQKDSYCCSTSGFARIEARAYRYSKY